MKNNVSVTFMLVFVFMVPCLISCYDSSHKVTSVDVKPVKRTNEDIVKQGEHFVKIMGCNDCHSPKKMAANGPEIIPELMLSGFPSNRPTAKLDTKFIKAGFSIFYPDLTAAAGPWGVSFAANLTPDSTGIGNWTEEQFKTAITQGKYKGLQTNRMLLPPMPWVNYATLSDEEVKSIFAYLKSVKPVKNLIPQPIAPDKL